MKPIRCEAEGLDVVEKPLLRHLTIESGLLRLKLFVDNLFVEQTAITHLAYRHGGRAGEAQATVAAESAGT